MLILIGIRVLFILLTKQGKTWGGGNSSISVALRSAKNARLPINRADREYKSRLVFTSEPEISLYYRPEAYCSNTAVRFDFMPTRARRWYGLCARRLVPLLVKQRVGQPAVCMCRTFQIIVSGVGKAPDELSSQLHSRSHGCSVSLPEYPKSEKYHKKQIRDKINIKNEK